MDRSNSIKNVSILGFVGNVLLLICKLLIGFTTGSQAMIADGLNSSGDVFSSVMTYMGNAISSQPEDRDHPYGHGKAEYIFSFIISFSFFFVAFTVLKSGISNLIAIKPVQYSIWLVIIALANLAIKALLFLYASKIGKKFNSLLALANAEDHRNDLFITTLTLTSIICAYFQIFYVDALVGILISFWLAYTGYKVLMASYHVLMDRTLDQEIITQMKAKIEATPGVDHIDSVVARPLGPKFLILIKISVDTYLNIQQGHDICDRVKLAVMAFEDVSDVLIHLNPSQYHPRKNYLK